MQSVDDAEERGGATDADSGAPTEQSYARLRGIFLMAAGGGAVAALVVGHVLVYLVPEDFDALPLWLAPPMSALVSFVGAFLCALGC
jgi:hypothetical protein